MLSNLKKRKEEGFTIIEVMIVLAIAGLIILVVLLAIPALQRNSRNTSIKNDASAVAAAINEYSGSNNGRMPTTYSIADGTINVGGSGTPTTGKAQGGTTGGLGEAPGEGEVGVINVTFGNKCADDGAGVGPASPRSAAILYNTETSTTTASQCIEA